MASSVALFDLGHSVITRLAREFMGEHWPEHEWRWVCEKLLERHSHGDWSEMSELNRAFNASAVLSGDRVMSLLRYDGMPFWVVTDPGFGGAVTTILLPGEYEYRNLPGESPVEEG